MPSDAASIRIIESMRGDATEATVLMESVSELDPALCAPVERQSGPRPPPEGAPNVYTLDATVFAVAAAMLIHRFPRKPS
ncbi:hypothetical protein [Microbacterium terregens]|uniref:Uncharacterized protein n=1 Tax=Microbacterium terregens TaxID=69363 RepID=A0ABV5T3B3_9MICO